MPEVDAPDIPEGLVLFTRLPSTVPYRLAELHVEYKHGDQVSAIVQELSHKDSRYRDSADIRILRSLSDELYKNLRTPEMYRFNNQIMKWTRSLSFQ